MFNGLPELQRASTRTMSFASDLPFQSLIYSLGELRARGDGSTVTFDNPSVQTLTPRLKSNMVSHVITAPTMILIVLQVPGQRRLHAYCWPASTTQTSRFGGQCAVLVSTIMASFACFVGIRGCSGAPGEATNRGPVPPPVLTSHLSRRSRV